MVFGFRERVRVGLKKFALRLAKLLKDELTILDFFILKCVEHNYHPLALFNIDLIFLDQKQRIYLT